MHSDHSELFCVPSLSTHETRSEGADSDVAGFREEASNSSRLLQNQTKLALHGSKQGAHDAQPSAGLACDDSYDIGVASPQDTVDSSSLSSPKVQAHYFQHLVVSSCNVFCELSVTVEL